MKGTMVEVATYQDRRAKKRVRVSTRNEDEIGTSIDGKGSVTMEVRAFVLLLLLLLCMLCILSRMPCLVVS